MELVYVLDNGGNRVLPITHIDSVRDDNGNPLSSLLPETMVASGTNHAGGLVPDTPNTAGTTKFLREDGTWSIPNSYESKTASENGIDVSLVTTGEKHIWNNKQDSIEFNTTYNASSNKAATMADIPSSIPFEGGDATTVNNHTVASDVPANAIFTDNNTTYKFTIGSTTLGDTADGISLGILESKAAAASGTDLSLVTTGEKAIWNAKTSNEGTVTGVTVGTGGTNYTPTNGVVTIPAYPTTLPASDVSAWAKANSKPSYTYPEVDYTVNVTTSAGGTLSLAGTTPLHVITLTGNVSALTLSSNPADGHSCHVILTSTAAQTVAIAHDSTNRICPEAADISLDVPAGGYVEIDFLSANNKVFVRGI